MSYFKWLKSKSYFLTIGLTVIFISGCGAKQHRRVEHSGFLGDYSQMKEGENNEALYVYINPKSDCRKYTNVLIEPVTFWDPKNENDLHELDKKDKNMLASMAWGTLYDAMRKGNFGVVFKPGPEVLRVKAAITEAEEAYVIPANIMAFAPYLWEATTLWGIGVGKWPFLGELAWEIEITDSMTGERLLAKVDKVVGTLFSNMDPAAEWEDVRQGFDLWRDRYGKRMQSCRLTGSFAMPEDDRPWLQQQVEYWTP